MSNTLHIHPEPPRALEGTISWEAVVETPDAAPWTLWFRTAAEHAPCLSASTVDPFVLAGLFHAMRRGWTLRVDGPVSPSLIRNLQEFQSAWARWMPDRYRRIEIEPHSYAPLLHTPPPRVMTAFSGGLDSCFTVWQQTRKESVAARRVPDAGLMVHGLDIPVGDDAVFARAAAKARTILSSAGVSLVTLATNLRAFGEDWDDAHGAGVAACLHAMGAQHGIALIPGTHAYEALRLPFGSNPVTDPLLSSERLAIVYEGAGYSRVEKALAVSEWPEALQNLRVCWQGAHLDRNCGICGKCVALGICFAVNRLPVPDSMPIPDLAAAIRRATTTPLSPSGQQRMRERLALARERGIAEPWVQAMEEWIRHSEGTPPRKSLWRRIARLLFLN